MSSNRADMLDDLDELYQQVILDHSRRPRNFRALENADAHAEGYNPLCGDRVTVYLKRGEGRLRDVAFQGAGCAICTAAASMMTQAVAGRPEAEVRQIFERFHRLLTGNGDATEDEEALGKLVVFAGVRKYPIRVKCATLPWHTLKAALERTTDRVSTE